MNPELTINRLESQLDALLVGLIDRRKDQVDFLIGLNRLDDILLEQQAGRDQTEQLGMFLGRYQNWLDSDKLKNGQRARVSTLLSEFLPLYIGRDDLEGIKISDEIRQWLRVLGNGSIKLTVKSAVNQGSLSDNYRALLKREHDEMEMLFERSDHLLGVLDDLLKSAEAKPDLMYQHMAASIIYYLRLDGYKIDPYIERLRKIKKDRERS